jgi:hypothetical protein
MRKVNSLPILPLGQMKKVQLEIIPQEIISLPPSCFGNAPSQTPAG